MPNDLNFPWHGLALIESLYGQHDAVQARLHQDPRCHSMVSQLDRHYDFYHDIILRHLGRTKRAAVEIVEQQRNSRTRRWSYRELSSLVTQAANRLFALGVRAGDVVALSNLGQFQKLVYSLAILTLGCAYAVLPPKNKDAFSSYLFNRRIRHVKPQWLVTGQQELTFDPSEFPSSFSPPQVIDEAEDANSGFNQESFEFPYHWRYFQPEQTVCIHFAFSDRESCAPYYLTAKDLFLSLMLNSLSVMDVQRGMEVICAGEVSEYTQPELTMSVLLCGGQFVDATDALPQLVASRWSRLMFVPHLLKKVDFLRRRVNRILLLTPAARAQLSDTGQAIQPCQRYLVFEDDERDEQWQLFRKRCQSSALSLSLDWRAQLAGVVGISLRHPKTQQRVTVPLPGRSFQLIEPNTQSLVSGGAGVCAFPVQFQKDEESTEGEVPEYDVTQIGMILTDNECHYWKPPMIKRRGVIYPIQDVSNYLNRHEVTEKTTVWYRAYFLPEAYQEACQVRLLVFYCPRVQNFQNTEVNASSSPVIALVKSAISHDLDTVSRAHGLQREAIPDEIEWAPLYPRDINDQDKVWIHSHYRNGKTNFFSKELLLSLLSQYRCLVDIGVETTH